jgi:hypothetical protein
MSSDQMVAIITGAILHVDGGQSADHWPDYAGASLHDE